MIFCQIDQQLINIIQKYANGRYIIDCGCGDGLLGSLTNNVVSIDIFENENSLLNFNEVIYMDASNFPFDKRTMPVFIRPCHSIMFVDKVLNNVKKTNAINALYISMPHNLEKDIDVEKYNVKLVNEEWTGVDGEKIYLIEFGGK